MNMEMSKLWRGFNHHRVSLRSIPTSFGDKGARHTSRHIQAGDDIPATVHETASIELSVPDKHEPQRSSSPGQGQPQTAFPTLEQKDRSVNVPESGSGRSDCSIRLLFRQKPRDILRL